MATFLDEYETKRLEQRTVQIQAIKPIRVAGQHMNVGDVGPCDGLSAHRLSHEGRARILDAPPNLLPQ